MSAKTWIIFVIVCVAVLGGLVFWSKKDKVDVSNINQNKVLAATEASGNIADHVYGPAEGKALLIEYGDFQCPACASAFPILKDLKEEFKEELTFVFRNFPITSAHPNAKAAAAAAEAAGLQGKFWEMHDALYKNQLAWSDASVDERIGGIFEGYAKEIGVKDLKKFKSDISNSNVSDKVNFDLNLGRQIPVTGTPTILLDGKKIESNVWSNKEAFKKEIEKALK